MNKRHIVLCLALSLWGAGLWAQTDPFLYYDVQDKVFRYQVPQVFSPEAVSLGSFGNVPVSYYYGLPDITIPLTEVKGVGHTVPVSLSYHAGGHKTETRPGWVGLGWALRAGGCINRIIHGNKDEMTIEEAHYSNEILTNDPAYAPENLPNPGFLYHPGHFAGAASQNTTTFDQLCDFVGMIDYEPDEFQVSLDDLQGSFYFGNDGLPKVFTKGEPFYVTYTTKNLGDQDIDFYIGENGDYLKAHYFTFIDKIVLCSIHGVEYEFGGTMDAIDFSYVQTFSGIGPRIVASANTWFLRKIRYPNGEEVTFEYEKKDFPVVVTDVHTRAYVYYNVRRFNATYEYVKTTLESEGDYPRVDQFTREKNEYNEDEYSNLSYTILHPSYLKSIKCKLSGDVAYFHTSPADALTDLVDSFKMQLGMGRISSGEAGSHFSIHRFLSHNQYHRLDYLVSRSDSLWFRYQTAHHENGIEHKIRLRLLNFTKYGRNRDATPEKYSFEYNSRWLPSFNAKLSDHWGYYNGVYYGGVLPHISSGFQTGWMDYVNREMMNKRKPDSLKMKAEILTRITYPTGGSTTFVFEPHKYNRVVKQSPFSLEAESGMAGGLRIREILDSTESGSYRRQFRYNDSGVLSGEPIYAIYGSQSNSGNYDKSLHPGFFPTIHQNGRYMVIDTTQYYRRATEYIQNQLSSTGGSHVVYDTVTEERSDGSKIIYHYSSYEEMMDEDPSIERSRYTGNWMCLPFTSHDHARGLLLSRIQINASGSRIGHEEYKYEMMNDYSENITTVAKLIVAAGTNVVKAVANKIRLDYPVLKRKIISMYPEGMDIPQVETINFEYGPHRLLRKKIRSLAGVSEKELYAYACDFPTGEYQEMNARKLYSFPVEHVKLFSNQSDDTFKVVSSELLTWKQLPGGLFVPSANYRAFVGEGVPSASFNTYLDSGTMESYPEAEQVFSRYDDWGNLLLSEDRTGVPTTYYWTSDGCHPAAFFRGAKNGTRDHAYLLETIDAVSSDLKVLSSGASIDLEFNCARTGEVNVFLDFLKNYGRTVWWRMDGGTEHCQPWNYSNQGPDEEIEIQTIYSGTLSAGSHLFQITAIQGNYSDYAELEDGEEEDLEDDQHGPHSSASASMYKRSQTLMLAPVTSWGSISVQYPANKIRHMQVRSDDCLFADFEENGGGGVGFFGGKSGTGVQTLDFVAHPEKTYVVDWRERSSGGTWEYKSKIVSSSGPFTAGSAGKDIDHVRVFPVGAAVESYTWDSAGNLTSRTDARGVTESYRYDGLGRLVGVFDNDGNKVEGYQYNYKQQ